MILLAFAMLPGCASIANFAAMRSIPVSGPQNPVRDIAGIWQQGEGRDERGRPSRGFCGQLMFLTMGSKKPGIVKGSVDIYVFDNVGSVQEQARPLKTFHFTSEEWATFQRLTNLGMTYQLFIPYTRPGGHDAECQLHVKFTAEGSDTPFWSHPESITLRGSTGPAAVANAIDQQLTSSSALFSRAGAAQMRTSPNYADLLKKLQDDTNRTPPINGGSTPLRAAGAPTRQQADFERLQAVLEKSTTDPVQQAGYDETPVRREPVVYALHEELQK
jgi:hypothetical protein